MKKWKTVLAVVLAAVCLTGCSQFKAEHNAAALKKDGSVMAAVLDTLDKSYYSDEELKTTIDEAVADYNEGSDETAIVVKKFETSEENVQLYMNYASAEDYQKFNNVTFYAGDLQGAYDNNYEFPDTFQQVEKGKVTGTVTKSDILSGLNYYVLIYSEEMDVEVPGKIVYVSPDVSVTGKKTATNIDEVIEQQAEAGTETAEGKESEITEEGKIEVEEGVLETESQTETSKDTDGEAGEHMLTYIIYE